MRAHAALGDRVSCERLVGLADTLYARASGRDDDPAWPGYYDQAEFAAQVGTCYLDLEDPKKADRYLSTTLRLVPASKVRDRATYAIRRASAQTQMGNADRAAQMLLDTVPLMREAPSERNTRRMTRARERLPFPKRYPRTQELDQMLSALNA